MTPVGSHGPIYLDANILIYAIERGHPWTDDLAALLKRVYAGDLTAVTSELSLAEVLAKPYALASTDLIDTYEALFSDRSPLVVRSIDRPILRRTAHLRGAGKLRIADAIHVATALEAGCTRFVSNDHQLLGNLPEALFGCSAADVAAL
ncbi:MAG: type II toxin-antitoxin system VapC family toxin [Devosia sp.]